LNWLQPRTVGLSTEKLIGLWLKIAQAGVLETSSLSQLRKVRSGQQRNSFSCLKIKRNAMFKFVAGVPGKHELPFASIEGKYVGRH
jgi:hypothetical protein